jgi:hypothetical protein
MKKTLKFREYLIDHILNGEKKSTWRLFDDKDLKVGDKISLKNWKTGIEFASAEIVEIIEKKFIDLNQLDWVGHERYESDEEMYRKLSGYYNRKVTEEDVVKIINFELIRPSRK